MAVGEENAIEERSRTSEQSEQIQVLRAGLSFLGRFHPIPPQVQVSQDQ